MSSPIEVLPADLYNKLHNHVMVYLEHVYTLYPHIIGYVGA